jgi:hypothetical protein
MKDTIRAILLDPEARNTTEAAAITFGKQREPLLRVTGPARAFPPAGMPGTNYQQNGGQTIMVGPTSAPHRAANGDVLNLNTFVDSSGTPPYPFQAYSVGNTTPTYYLLKTSNTTGILTVNAPGYSAGNSVPLQFTSGPLSTGAYNSTSGTPSTYYTVASATSGANPSGSFTVTTFPVALTSSIASGSGNAFTPNNFTASTTGVAQTPGYTLGNVVSGNYTTVTVAEGTGSNLVAGQPVYMEFYSGGLLSSGNDGQYTVPTDTNTNDVNFISSSSFKVNLKTPIPQTTSIASIATSAVGTPCTITTATNHGLSTGMIVTIASVSNGSFASLISTGTSINSSFTVTVTGLKTFTVPVQCITAPTAGTGNVTLPTGNVLIPSVSGGYTVTNANGKSYIILQSGTNFDLNFGDGIYVNILLANSPIPAVDNTYTVINPASIPLAISPNQVVVQSPISLTTGTPNSGSAYQGFPLAIHQYNRSGTCRVDYGTFNIGVTSSLDQTALNSPTVFNFFYPSYSYPGAIAQAGMTTPEFQLTDATDTLNLTNTVISGILGNTGGSQVNGFMYFFNSSGPLVLDVGTPVNWPNASTNYMDGTWTGSQAKLTSLVSNLGTLLCGNNLTAGTQSAIVTYVNNTGNFPYSNPPTNQQISNQVRAVLQLILCSAEYAIQK